MDQETYNRVEALFRLLREKRLDELTVEDGSFKLHLRRRPQISPSPPLLVSPRRPSPAGTRPPAKGRTVAVRAPLIGVFYRAPAPDAPPFVEIGDVVKEGQTVCIVEAMKVFNEIKAEWNGRVIAIPAESGKLVQAGDPLVVLEFLQQEEDRQEG